jgi:hypothetical protein
MNKITRLLAGAAVVWAAADLRAEESAPAADTLAGVADGGVQKAPEKYFHLMPLCRLLEGKGEVRRPTSSAWEPLEEGRFYPLGCSFRTIGADARLTMQFGRESSVEVVGEASFGTLPQALDVKSRTLVLMGGTVDVKLPRNLPEGLFIVTAPGFSVINPSGESRYTYVNKGDGDLASVRCVTGSFSVKGRHFLIPTMRAADEIDVRTSQDVLFTGLYGKSGECIVKLDQGLMAMSDPVTGKMTTTEKVLDWRLSPKTAARIHRAKPAIGKRLSVTVMTFDETGALRNRCAFAEGRREINSGEQGVVAQEAKEDLAKKAAEAAETVETEETDEAKKADKPAPASEDGEA